MPFLDFYLIFYLIFIKYFLLKNRKKGGTYLQVLTWRAGAAGADLARGTTSKVRRGTKATWQSPGAPREAQVALTRGRRPRRRAHADAREGHHVAGKDGKWRAHGYSGTLVR